MGRVVWSDTSRSDVRSIFQWIARDSVINADRLVHRLLDAPNRLELFPGSGAPVEEFPTSGLRELFIGDYRIVYLYRNDECRIIRVIHGSRDLRRALDPESLP